MYREINIKSTVEKKKKKKVNAWLVLLVIISFVLPFLFVVYRNGSGNIVKDLTKQYTSIVNEFVPIKVTFATGIDEKTKTEIVSALSVMKLGEKSRFEFVGDSSIKIAYQVSDTDMLSTSYLVPVGHVYWVKDGTDSADIKKYKVYIPSTYSQEVKTILESNLGVTVYQSKDLLTELQTTEGKKIGLIDISDLNDKYKLLTWNKKYFLDDSTGGIKYGLGFVGDGIPEHTKVAAYKNSNVVNEMKKEDLLTVTMTGVTAISRNLAAKINASGRFDYPADNIYKLLSASDLTHTSNEVSFVAGCSPAQSMRFCADPRYIATLKKIGIDIVELTGNHNNDYGASNNTSTIKTYTKNGWDHFGGGLDKTDAAKILYKDIKGTKVAFIGYNYYDTVLGTGAIATDAHAGANSWSNSKVKKDVATARKNADVVIVDFQFQECYSYPEGSVIYPICYKALAAPDQKGTFRKAIDAGADLVIGTQAHQPQTFEVYKGKMIYYGLGNLFFDQTPWPGTRQGLILTHYMYKGKLLQTKMITTYYDLDMRVYQTTGTQRTLLLNLLKEARD